MSIDRMTIGFSQFTLDTSPVAPTIVRYSPKLREAALRQFRVLRARARESIRFGMRSSALEREESSGGFRIHSKIYADRIVITQVSVEHAPQGTTDTFVVKCNGRTRRFPAHGVGAGPSCILYEGGAGGLPTVGRDGNGYSGGGFAFDSTVTMAGRLTPAAIAKACGRRDGNGGFTMAADTTDTTLAPDGVCMPQAGAIIATGNAAQITGPAGAPTV